MVNDQRITRNAGENSKKVDSTKVNNTKLVNKKADSKKQGIKDGCHIPFTDDFMFGRVMTDEDICKEFTKPES